MREFYDTLHALLGGVFLLVVVVISLVVIVNVGLAPQPGDPFYPAWLDVTQYGWDSLLIAIPGVGAALYAVLSMIPDSGRF